MGSTASPLPDRSCSSPLSLWLRSPPGDSLERRRAKMAYAVGVHKREGPWQFSRRGLFYLILILYSVLTAIPFVWGFLNAFKTLPETAGRTSTVLPQQLTLDAWN